MGAKNHSIFLQGHFILPDTNVFLSQVCGSALSSNLSNLFYQMDLVESPLFTSPIILLQTVIEEVRHRSLPLYNRLKALTKVDEKKLWTFYNEYCS
jgi:exosome complex exonuclease DIS3/RRP44